MSKNRTAKVDSYFTLPYDVEEAFSEMHGSIDPDSGHIVCHKYTPRLGVIGNGVDHVPYIGFGECLSIVYGNTVVGKLLSILDAHQIDCLEIKQGSRLVVETSSGEVPVEDLVIAIHRLRMLGYGVVKLYLGRTSNGYIPVAIGVDKDNRREMIAVFIDPSCSRREEKQSTAHI